MKYNFIVDKHIEEYRAIEAVAGEIGLELCDDGIPVYLKQYNRGLRVSFENDSYMIEYSTRNTLMRGMGLLSRYAGKGKFNVSENPSFDMLGIMVDCSRNAVMKIDSVKKLCRIIALMGYNMLMLYTEDTYEIEKYPYFGHMRGRYTARQLQELDEYTEMLGIELVPCIQTLAHMDAIFRWPVFDKYRDCSNIMLAGSESVYELIDSMLSNMSKNIKSRNINIGMDEAHMLGLGKYLKKNGYKNPNEIMIQHLTRVNDLCKKYGYRPMMWSDMFFSMASSTSIIYDPDANITQEIIEKVPPELTLVYWNYIGTDDNKYNLVMDKHKNFKNPIAFAGGASCWCGLVPLNLYSTNSARCALRSIKKNDIKKVFVTLWGDDGGLCSVFGTLPTLILYAEECWNGDSTEVSLSEAMYACARADYKSFLDMELLTNIPGRTDYGEERSNAYRYMLYQDVLSGIYDRHIPDGIDKHFLHCRDELKASREKNPAWAYLFDSLIALCDILSIKADLGIRIKAAYDKKDTRELSRIKDEDFPNLLAKLDKLYECILTQWDTNNKPFGFDIQDLRFGGLMMRLRHSCKIINDYLSGKIDVIEELEQPRLYYIEPKKPPNKPIFVRRWSEIISPNILTNKL